MKCFWCSKADEVSRLRARIIALESGGEIQSLKEEIERQRKQLSEFQSGTSAARIQLPKNTTMLLRKIDRFEETIAQQKRQIEEAAENLRNMEKQGKKDHAAQKKRIDELERQLSTETWRHEKEIRELKEEHRKALAHKEDEHEKALEKQKAAFESQLRDKDKVIEDLRRILNPKASVIPPQGQSTPNEKPKVQTNSQNSSMPPSQDPNHRTIVPNNREKTGRPVGGQAGHEPHPRKHYAPDECITVDPPAEVQEHPEDYYAAGIICKQLVTMHVVLKVTEYQAVQYRNRNTKQLVHGAFPENLGHLETNYDRSVEALIAWLHSCANMPYNKIREFLSDQTGGLLCPSESMMVNLERRFSEATQEKRDEIARKMLLDPYMNIDGTFLRVNGKLENTLILRTDSGTCYVATGCKGKKAVDQTFADQYHGNIICDGETTFHSLGSDYQHCLIHTSRYLKGAMENEPWLTFPSRMRSFLWELVKRRDIQASQGLSCMPENERNEVRNEYRKLIDLGTKEYELHPAGDYRKGYTTFQDLAKNMDHYLLFLEDYRIPFHNNAAEKGARAFKVHSKINGGLRSKDAMEYHADTMTVLETASMNGENRMEVLKEGFEKAKAQNGQAHKQDENVVA